MINAEHRSGHLGHVVGPGQLWGLGRSFPCLGSLTRSFRQPLHLSLHLPSPCPGLRKALLADLCPKQFLGPMPAVKTSRDNSRDQVWRQEN